MTPLELAHHYVDLSNVSNLDGIRALMTGSTTYSSDSTGVFLGVNEIMRMQSAFHRSFETVTWKILEAEEVKPGIVRFAFEFAGTKRDGRVIETAGVETVVIYDGKLQHIEIRNR